MIELDNLHYENELYQSGYSRIAGLDEVGRGPMAGPLVVAAVILNKKDIIPGLTDSKQLSAKQRVLFSQEIKKRSLAYYITFLDVKTVDELNVYQTSKKGMLDCLAHLDFDYALTDAMPLKLKNSLSIIKGDLKSASIAAASIIAKVARDDYMIELAKKYPQYGFDKHKGYCTKQHLEALKKYGVIEGVHRKSFKPVKEQIEKVKQLSLFEE